jgi:hypothetical protein
VLYSYPPPFALLLQPLALLNYRMSQWVWFGMNVALLLMLTNLSLRLSGWSAAPRYASLIGFMIAVAPPTRVSLQLGQVSLLIGVLLAMSLALRQRSALVGTLVALASWIKITPALMSGYYLLRRSVVFWWITGMGLILFAVTLVFYGIEPYISFVTQVVYGWNDYPYAAEHNISLNGFWLRLLTATKFSEPVANAPGLARALTLGFSIAVLVLCPWMSRGATDQQDERLRWSLWLCASLLLSPANGYYNLVILVLPLLLMVGKLEARPDRKLTIWLGVATLLICIAPTWTDSVPILYTALHTRWVLLTPSLYGLIIYMIVLVHMIRRPRSTILG